MPGRTERILLGALLLASGCGAGDKAVSSSLMVELTQLETGVQIVPEALLMARPGDGDGFSEVRGALSTASGELAVADAGLHQVLLFDRTGTIVGRVGRQGSGPGEFREPALVAFWGDSLAVFDPPQRRLSYLRRDGTLIRLRTVSVPGTMVPTVLGVRADGTLIYKGTVLEGPAEGSRVSSAHAVVLAIDARDGIDTIAVIPDGPWLANGPFWYAWRSAAAVTDSGVWSGSGAFPIIWFHSWSGAAMSGYQWAAATRAVNERDRNAIIALAGARDAAPSLTGPDRFADSIPYFGRILNDPLGGVWMIASNIPFEAPDSVWRIDEKAKTVQVLKLPIGFRPMQVGRDFLLGFMAGDDGTIQVVRYPLLRGP